MSNDDNDNLHSSGAGGANGDLATDVLIDRLTAAVRATPVPDGPDESTLAATLAALRAANASPVPPMRLVGASVDRKPVRRALTIRSVFVRLAVAACVLLAAGALLFAPLWGNTVAFAKVVEQVNLAKSVRFKAFSTIQMADGKEQSVNSTIVIVGDRLRQELPNAVQVMDMLKGEMVVLDTAEKKGMRLTLENMPPNVKSVNLLDQFRSVKPDKAKDIGSKTLDGRTLRGFQIDEPGHAMTVWADPKTKEPVRIEMTIAMASLPRTTSVMTDFTWDMPVDESQMTLDVPPGYDMHSLTMDASIPTEKDLIEGLRLLSTLNGGEFPGSYDLIGLGTAFKRYVTKKPETPEEMKAVQAELMPKVLQLTRGLGFVTGDNGDEWHYAGSGVKLDEANRAVMWYRPKGSPKYRVIGADLSVREVSADELPKVEAKKMTPGASPFTPPPPPTSQSVETK